MTIEEMRELILSNPQHIIGAAVALNDACISMVDAMRDSRGKIAREDRAEALWWQERAVKSAEIASAIREIER